MADKGKPYPTAAYPTQQYPTQGYPVGSYPQPPMGTQYPYASSQYPTYGQPPPYSQGPSAPPMGPPPAYTPAQPSPQPYAAAYYTNPASMPAVARPPPGPQGTVHVNNLFDAGCRFDGVAQPNIPPPPPGCTPNAAQMAAMQGYQVTGTQKSGSFWSGSGDGGYTFW